MGEGLSCSLEDATRIDGHPSSVAADDKAALCIRDGNLETGGRHAEGPVSISAHSGRWDF